MNKNLTGTHYRTLTDAGYESEENYSYFESIPTGCYIKPQNYERSKTKKHKSNMALRENMAYDAELDEYTCQAGRKLRARYTGIQETKSGYKREVTYYECDSCADCPFKKKCTRAKQNRKLQVSKKFIAQREASLERITSEKGILLQYRINVPERSCSKQNPLSFQQNRIFDLSEQAKKGVLRVFFAQFSSIQYDTVLFHCS